MNYIWELLLLAGREQVGQETFRFIPAANPSPYRELAVDILNLKALYEISHENLDSLLPAPPGISGGEPDQAIPIEVNPLYRFAGEFSRILDINLTGLEQTRQIFFDTCLHYHARLDLLSGRRRHEYYLRLLERDLYESFDGEIRQAYGRFNLTEQDIILRGLLTLCRTGNSRQEFRRAVTAVYPKAIIYESTDSANELLVYLGKEETAREQERIGLLISLFLSLQETVSIFYARHFGIIGIDETMVLDEMVLF